MSLLRNLIRSTTFHRMQPNQTLPFVLRHSVKHFSTETENQRSSPLPPPPQQPQVQQQQPQQNQAFSSDSFVPPPSTGFVYAKLTGAAKHTLKSDILNMLEGCDLTLADLKIEYSRIYSPLGVIMRFSSAEAYDTAFRMVRGKGRMYTIEKVDPNMWNIKDFEGRAVLLQGLPRTAQMDDIERFLCGGDFNASNMQIFMRPTMSGAMKMALVEFRTQTEAMRAVLLKNRNFCLNSQIMARVLQ